MGHFRQYLLRGTVPPGSGGGPPATLGAPILWAGAYSGGWPITLTCVIGSPPLYYMLLYNSAAGLPVNIVQNFGPVSGSPSIIFISDDYGGNYWTRLAEHADGTGILGPLSDVYHPAY